MSPESAIYEPLCRALERRLDGRYECRPRERLVYDLRYDSSGAVDDQSFRTDVAVFEDQKPRVVIEIKRSSVTTHDLIVYDSKARRHKQTRPYLRYGMAAFGMNSRITKRYLWHGDALDFFFLSEESVSTDDEVATGELRRLVDVLERNLEASRRLEHVLGGYAGYAVINKDVRFYETSRKIEDAD